MLPTELDASLLTTLPPGFGSVRSAWDAQSLLLLWHHSECCCLLSQLLFCIEEVSTPL